MTSETNPPSTVSPPKREQFLQAEKQWDLARLYQDLATAKGKATGTGQSRSLSRIEKLHLRGLLCGLSPAEMACKLHKSVTGLEADLSCRIYQYVKMLVNKSTEKMENWRNVCEWLAPYKIQIEETSLAESSKLPIEFTIKSEENIVVSNIIVIQNNNGGVKIDINLRVQEDDSSPRSNAAGTLGLTRAKHHE